MISRATRPSCRRRLCRPDLTRRMAPDEPFGSSGPLIRKEPDHGRRRPLSRQSAVLQRSARSIAASRGAPFQAIAAAAADRALRVPADAGPVAAALLLRPPVDGVSQFVVGGGVCRPRPVPGSAHRPQIRLGRRALTRFRDEFDAGLLRIRLSARLPDVQAVSRPGLLLHHLHICRCSPCRWSSPIRPR